MTKLFALPTSCSKHPSTPRATQSQPWPYPTQATRALLSVNPCTVILLNDSSRYRPEGETIMLEHLRAELRTGYPSIQNMALPWVRLA